MIHPAASLLAKNGCWTLGIEDKNGQIISKLEHSFAKRGIALTQMPPCPLFAYGVVPLGFELGLKSILSSIFISSECSSSKPSKKMSNSRMSRASNSYNLVFRICVLLCLHCIWGRCRQQLSLRGDVRQTAISTDKCQALSVRNARF